MLGQCFNIGKFLVHMMQHFKCSLSRSLTKASHKFSFAFIDCMVDITTLSISTFGFMNLVIESASNCEDMSRYLMS